MRRLARIIAGSFLSFAAVSAGAQPAVDAKAAEALAKKSKCFQCHSVTQKKDAPAFREIAAKHKGKPDADKVLFKHLTTNPLVEVEGKKEEHENLRTKNEAEIYNVVHWILSR